MKQYFKHEKELQSGAPFIIDQPYDDFNGLVKGRDLTTGERFRLSPKLFVDRYRDTFNALLGMDDFSATAIKKDHIAFCSSRHGDEESMKLVGHDWRQYVPNAHGVLVAASAHDIADSGGVAKCSISAESMVGGKITISMITMPIGGFNLAVARIIT